MIPDKEPVNTWDGNSSNITFDFDFLINSEKELLVLHTDKTGIQNTLKLNIDYTIHQIGNADGSYITFPILGSSYKTLGEGEKITLMLNIPIAQTSPYGTSEKLNLKSLEFSLDYIVRLIQMVNRKVQRSVKVQEGSNTTPDDLIESLNQAQINAQNFAQIAAEKATSANNSAIAAGEEATIATQQAAIVQETYDKAMADIETDRLAALEDMANAKNDYNANATNKSNDLQKQFENYTANLDGQLDVYLKNYDRLYQGVDLEVKFATEIAAAGNVYAWLESRKNAGSFEGIHVGDYFSVSMSAGTVAGYSISAQTFKCRIVGINTYKSCADTNIGNMFYIISDEVVSTEIKWNPTDNNNGTASQNNPWLSSAAYAILNGVNNYTTNAYNKVAHGANASGKGILQLLPSTLQSVLKQKRALLDNRYSASGLLTGSTGWVWGDMGKLWLPNEYEVYGCAVRSNLSQTSGFWHPEAGLSIQFPWFANNCEHRVKKNSSGGRCSWWLSAPASYDTNGVCLVHSYGYAGSLTATYSGIFVPLCFCI